MAASPIDRSISIKFEINQPNNQQKRDPMRTERETKQSKAKQRNDRWGMCIYHYYRYYNQSNHKIVLF